MFGTNKDQMKEVIKLLRVIRDNTTPRAPLPMAPIQAYLGKTEKTGKKLFSKKERKEIRRLAVKALRGKLTEHYAGIVSVLRNTDELSVETAMLASENYETAHALIDLYGACAAMLDTCRDMFAGMSGGDYSKFDGMLKKAMERFAVKPELIGVRFGDNAITQDIANMEKIDGAFAARSMQIAKNGGRWWIDPKRHLDAPDLDGSESDDSGKDDPCCEECRRSVQDHHCTCGKHDDKTDED